MTTVPDKIEIIQKNIKTKISAYEINSIQTVMSKHKDDMKIYLTELDQNIKRLDMQIKLEDEEFNKDMGNIKKSEDTNRKLQDESLKMNKKLENIDKSNNKKKNIIYILFFINLILAIIIIVTLYFKINNNINISKTFLTKIKN